MSLQTDIFQPSETITEQVLVIISWSLKRTFYHVEHALLSAELHRRRRDDDVN